MTRSRCSSCTASCTCSAGTTPIDEEAERMEARERELLARHYRTSTS